MLEVYLPCSTIGCKNTPHKIAASTARALYEYRLHYDPGYVFKVDCTKCNGTSTYTYDQIVNLIPPDNRPQPLPHDHFWAYMLFELDVWKNKDYRAYLGDRVLVQRLTTEPTGYWYGVLKTASPYAPSLKAGNYIKGRRRGKYELCLDIIEGVSPRPIPKPAQLPKSSSFGLFVSPKANEKKLLGANLLCSNPSCPYIYSTMTYTKFTGMIGQEQLNEQAYDEETSLPTIKLACPMCGTERVIDEGSFDGMYKEKDMDE